jgi:ABC-2 type transport system permease protein
MRALPSLRSLGSLRAQLRVAMLTAAQYRLDFALDGAIEIVWVATALVPLAVVFGRTGAVAGWSAADALVVVGLFTLLQSFVEGALNPALAAFAESVRRGTLDAVLLKPVDAQLWVAASQLQPWRATSAVAGVAMVAAGAHASAHAVDAAAIASAVALAGCAMLLVHAIWTLAMCAAIAIVGLEGLGDVLLAVLDGARWPTSIVRGGVRVALTFVVPLGLLTTVPAEALLGTLSMRTAIAACVETVVVAGAARLLFRAALRAYVSPGG